MYDPEICLETMKLMKAGLESAGLKPYLMMQPVGFHTQDSPHDPSGYNSLPEWPFGKFRTSFRTGSSFKALKLKNWPFVSGYLN